MDYKDFKAQILNSPSLTVLVKLECQVGASDLSKKQKTTLYKYVRARAGNYL